MAFPFNRAEFEIARKSHGLCDVSFSSVHVFRSTKAAFGGVDPGQRANLALGDVESFHGLAHFCLEYCDLFPGFFSAPLRQIPPRQIAAENIEQTLQALSPAALKSVGLDSPGGFGVGVILLDDWNEKMLVWEN